MKAGNNIKKIRTLKSLSQSAFAELFNVKRANISAYEEGRANPKSELAIKIANYFNIPVEDFLTRELTINELVKFDGPMNKYLNKIGNKKTVMDTSRIPLLRKEALKNFIINGYSADYLSSLPKIGLPFPLKGIQMALEIDILQINLLSPSMKNGDIVFCEKRRLSQSNILDNKKLLLKTLDRQLIVTHVKVKSHDRVSIIQSTFSNFSIRLSELQEIYEIKGLLTFELDKENFMENRIRNLEDSIKVLNKYLKRE